MKKLAKVLAVVLCISMLLGMTAMLAGAENAVVEAKTADDLCAACDALAANPTPTTIKLTADMTPAYAEYNTSRNSVIGVLPEGSVLDLNGHTITFSNVKFDGKIIDSVGGGKVCYVAGNKTRLGEACEYPVTYGFENLVSEIRISNKNATQTPDTTRRFPADSRIYANSAIELFFETLTIGSGCTVESSVTVNATNGIILEAAKPEDLALSRLAMAGVTRIVLTADIKDENLSVFVPADAVLDYNGHKLTCKAVTGKTEDSSTAQPATPAEPAPGAKKVIAIANKADMDAAFTALTTEPTTLKLTASLSLSYKDYEESTFGKHVAGILPENWEIDLNGKALTFSNAVIEGKIVDSTGNGKVLYACGNPSRFTNFCDFAVKYGYADLISECRISSDNVTNHEETNGENLSWRIPENQNIYASSERSLKFDNVIVGAGTNFDMGNLIVTSAGEFIVEAATAEDLAMKRMMWQGITKVVLTADIDAPDLNVLVPGTAVLDLAGHKLTAKSINGNTTDSGKYPELSFTPFTFLTKEEPAAPATPATPAEPAAPAAPATPATPAAPGTPTAAGTKYTVKDGDCLYAIARSLMGGGWNWPALYEANKAVIGSNPRLIYTGTVLTIPGGTTATTTTEPAKPAETTPATPAAPAELNPVQTISVGQFHSAEKGTEVTYTVSGVTGAKVEARIPAGTEYVSCTADGKFADGKITWDAAKGDVTFTVKVTGALSFTILSDGVTANGKAVNKIATGIRGKEISLISKQLLAAMPVGEGSESSNNTPGIVALALEKGANVKTDITITSANLLRAVFVTEDTNYEKDGALGKHLDKAPSADTAHIYNMLVPGYYCGRQIEGTGDETQVKTFDLADLEIGDVLVAGEMNLGYVKDGSSSNKAYATLIKLSDTKVIIGYRNSRTELKSGWKVVEMNDAAQAEIQEWMTWQYFFLLRPTQAYADITTK